MPRALARARTALTLVGAVAVLAACTSQAMPTPTPTPTPTPLGDGVLRIGTLFPTSGSVSFIAPAQVAGVNAALREINAAGGLDGTPVEVLNRDSGDAGSEKAEQSFAELVERGVDVVIGPSSSVLAQRLLPAAEEAGVVLISPAATYPQLTTLDEAGLFFRTIPHYGHQGAILADVFVEDEAEAVALVYRDDELGRALLAELEAGLADPGIPLTAVPVREDPDAARVAGEVKEAAPDAVVLATPDNGKETRALITALTGAGFGGSKLWLTSQNLADYSQSLPAGLLKGANGILEGVDVDDAFKAKIKREDPAVRDYRYAAEAYDATVLAVLAALQAGDDAGVSVAAALRDASVGGVKCTSFGECVAALATQPDIDYDGITGALNWDLAGDRTTATYGLYGYNEENKYSRSGSRTG